MMGTASPTGDTAQTGALALLQAASDPAGTRERLEQLNAAITEHAAAQAKAATATGEATARLAQAEVATEAVAKRENAVLAWKAAEEKSLSEADAAARRAEEANRTRAASLDAREAALAKQSARLATLMQTARDCIAAYEAEAAR
jgi:hypothetical protein